LRSSAKVRPFLRPLFARRQKETPFSEGKSAQQKAGAKANKRWWRILCMRFLVAAAFVAVLLAGCAQQLEGSQQPAKGATFVLPSSNISYHAVYNIEEGGIMEKEAWRAPGKMRADLSVQGVRALSFYFVDSRAYSCSFLSKPPSCYDVTATLSRSDASKIVPDEKDYAGLALVRSVKIGDTTGSCYDHDVVGMGRRETCFAVGGVVAYDSYNTSKSVQHTEYLTSLEIYPQEQGPESSVFILPAAPVAAPEMKALQELPEE